MRDLEARDRYFTRLQREIEDLVAAHQGEKVVVLSHSMGANVWVYFMQWVSSPQGGHGGAAWVDTHVASAVLIGNALLGSPKVPGLPGNI